MCSDRIDPTPPPAGYIPIRDYFEALMKMTQRAVDMARADMERRMDGFPEQFVRKGEIDIPLAKLASQVELLTEIKNKMEGKASQKFAETVMWISVTSMIVGLLGLILRFYKV